MRRLRNVLVTGGAGFIGSNFIRFLLGRQDFVGTVVNVDKLTYAGNLDSLTDVDRKHGGSRYSFERADICDHDAMRRIVKNRDVDTIVHFAAESHVDRSIFGPADFVQANIVGTCTLLEAAREAWQNRDDTLFHHVSTDEVFGSLQEGSRGPLRGRHSPTRRVVRIPLQRRPRTTWSGRTTTRMESPLHSDQLQQQLRAVPVPGKADPLMILNILEDKPLPVYGDGRNVRDWLYVEDHAAAVWCVMTGGRERRDLPRRGRRRATEHPDRRAPLREDGRAHRQASRPLQETDHLRQGSAGSRQAICRRIRSHPR